MKIGILTYHRAENYGALLQAYALRTYLQSLGHDVAFVDYWPDYHKEYFDLFSFKRFFEISIKAKLVMLYNLLFLLIRKKRKRNLQKFMYERLELPKHPKYNDKKGCCRDFDVVFYGSDQIWRKQGMPSHPGFDLWYFGSNNIIAKKKIAYAASLGASSLSQQEKMIIENALKNFLYISVRESSLKVLVNNLGYNCVQVIDPVFLLDKNQWSELTKDIVPQYNKYILVYNLLAQKETASFAEILKRKFDLPIIEITKSFKIGELTARYNHTAVVEEFLSLIENAEFVVSNSFHGVAFSIIFEKQFYAVGMGSKSERVISLLELLGLNNRYVVNGNYDENSIEYEKIRESLIKSIEYSKRFITDSL